MARKKLTGYLRKMPRGAYIFLRSVLQICCVMLLISAALFMELEGRPADHGLYMLASLFLENPAGVLLAGLIGLGFLLDHL